MSQSEEDIAPQPGGENQVQTMKAIFGDDSDSDSDSDKDENVTAEGGKTEHEHTEKDIKPNENEVRKNDDAMKSIFGEDSDSDLDEDEKKDAQPAVKTETADTSNMDFMYDADESQASQSTKKATHATLCIPRSHKIPEGNKTIAMRLPNFLKIQTIPYTKQSHNEEAEASLFPGATSMIRWAYKFDKNGDVERDTQGKPIRVSNTRLVKWSDGSYQLLVGQEVFDSSIFPVSDSYLYTQRKSALPRDDDAAHQLLTEDEKKDLKSDTCLECIGASTERIVLRPSSVVSAAHARLSLAISEKYSRKTKIKGREYEGEIINAEKDTDARAAAINEDLRKERRRRAQQEAVVGGTRISRPSMSSQFMEEEDGFDSTNLREIKKSKKFKSRARFESDEEEEDELEDEDDDGFIVNDEDMDEDDDEDHTWRDRIDQNDNDSQVPSKQRNSAKKKNAGEASVKDSDSSEDENFEVVKPKKRSQSNDKELESQHSDEQEAPAQKKKRRTIVESSDEDE